MIALNIAIPVAPLRLRAKINRKGGLISIGHEGHSARPAWSGRKVGIAWRAPALSGGVYKSASWSPWDGGEIEDGAIRINPSR
jgi:hypothetical protein